MSGGETSLSGTDNNSLALKYTPGYESVFINGVLQVRGSDYVATTGTTVTGLTALTANDVVMVESIIAYSVGDTYTQTQIGSLLDAKSPVSTTGLVLITQATIGTAVSSVVVTNAFSATYENYKIVISGGAGSTEDALRMQLGASATGYYAGIGTVNYSGAATSNASDNNTTLWSRVGRFSTNVITMNIDVLNPFLPKLTLYFGQYIAPNTGAGSGFASGFHNVSTSYTDFTLTPASGTLTGGTIKVYGYK
jgi:hypothetical protein